jgi:alpha-beta hydrolase superfamily lysophospholipase
MFNKIMVLSLAACTALVLQSCHSDDDALFATVPDAAPQEVGDISGNAYGSLRSGSSALNGLFVLAGTVAGTGTAVGDEPCNVKMHKMTYDTVGGAGEATTSTGVVMVPYGENAACNGPRPVVLYAHGTSANRDYDLSAFPSDTSNPAAGEAGIMLAFYAAQGYTVVAPNYAGYADSALSYHPYADEAQQTTEMIDALSHVRTYASNIGANLSSQLFVTGLSQGGYVAMATHKALQLKGEPVAASVPISGPYALRDYLDSITGGRINGGATTFAPMYITALDEAFDIYDDASEVYAADYASFAHNSLPAPGASQGTDVGLPADADLFTLLSDGFSSNYVDDVNGVTVSPNAASKIRALAQDADLRDWAPSASAQAPVIMCGASNDPVVFHDVNSDAMATFWSAYLPSGLVVNLDLTDATDSAAPALDGFDGIRNAWQAAGVPLASVHGATGAYCAGAALGTFNAISSAMAAASN